VYKYLRERTHAFQRENARTHAHTHAKSLTHHHHTRTVCVCAAPLSALFVLNLLKIYVLSAFFTYKIAQRNIPTRRQTDREREVLLTIKK
jgi:hypothetical protein